MDADRDSNDHIYTHINGNSHHHDYINPNGNVDCDSHDHSNGDTEHHEHPDGYEYVNAPADLNPVPISIERMRRRVIRGTR